MVIFTGKVRNVLKRMQNQFFDFYFLRYGNFCNQNMVNFRWIFLKNSKNKNRKILKYDFSFVNNPTFTFYWVHLPSQGIHFFVACDHWSTTEWNRMDSSERNGSPLKGSTSVEPPFCEEGIERFLVESEWSLVFCGAPFCEKEKN